MMKPHAKSRHQGQGDLFYFEKLFWSKGYASIAGVDEVGRGPLAGPVVVAAVILPRAGCLLPVADSKVLSAKKRDMLARELRKLSGIQIAISVLSAAEIDRINILRATHVAMRKAVLQLNPKAQFALVDGLPVPEFPVPSEFLVKGDARSASIAAASIIAKVYRDDMMVALDAKYPGYGFARHKGYGTAAHLEALQRLGPSPLHRKTFAPVAWAAAGNKTQLEFTFSDKQPPTPE